MRLGGWEIALILVLVLVIFGAGKLPEVGRSLGKSIREFRKASKGEDEGAPQPPTQAQSKQVAGPVGSDQDQGIPKPPTQAQ